MAEAWSTLNLPRQRGPVLAADERRERLLALLPAVAAGVVVFGFASLAVIVESVLVCVLTARLCNRLTGRTRRGSNAQAALIGLLLALTLPATAGWEVPLAAGFIAIVVGTGLQPGMSEYLWHPALVGRIGAQMFYREQLIPSQWPVLGPGHLLFGNLWNTKAPREYQGWFATPVPAGADGFRLENPLTWLGALRQVPGVGPGVGDSAPPQGAAGPHALTVLIRDHLPPWEDTVLGLTGGGLGETCVIALIAGGCYLIHRGIVNWFVPLVVFASALVAAALLPLSVAGANTVPLLLFDGPYPVGWIYILFELTTGELALVAVFFATDWPSTPLTRRGRLLFAALVGTTTIVLTRWGLVPGAGYWAVLGANLLVPAMDRFTRRRVVGTRRAGALSAAVNR